VEYKHKAENGLTNQGWKDSFDAVFHSTWKLAEPPLALCEVQGYVYAAKKHIAKLAAKLGDRDLCNRLDKEADLLKAAFNEQFWDEELKCFVLALDKDKQPCRVKSSNAGQLLFTGIVIDELAAKLVNTLMQPDMFNGWGIRTISSNELRYNPMSYHNGSVWPHDVSLIALGFAKYGFKKETAQLTTGLFDASLFIPLQRLPELICGFERRKGEAPTSYPVACSPQAWSVSAVFMLLYGLLQIEIDPEQKQISFHNPFLPAYIENVLIKELKAGNLLIDLEINRHKDDSQISVYWKNQPNDWKLIVIR
jgi:glycogen debranching enzyme